MSLQDTTSQIEVLEQHPKPKKFKIKTYKKLYKDELKRRKKVVINYKLK